MVKIIMAIALAPKEMMKAVKNSKVLRNMRVRVLRVLVKTVKVKTLHFADNR